ncbi:MAG: hypothetical protein QXR73_01780 [Candidatus Micrarchaeaceae archaeon]
MAQNQKSKTKRKRSQKSGSSKISVAYVKVDSLVDLARLMSGQGSLKHISAIKDGNVYKIIYMGERAGGVQIAYYASAPKLSKFFIYSPNSPNEYIKMEDSIASSINDYNLMKAPILEIVASPFKEEKKPSFDISIVEVNDFESFVKSIVSDSQYGGSTSKVYAFFYKGAHYVGSFELMRDSGKIFTYAKADESNTFNYLKYDYTKDRIEPTSTIAEKSFTYVRVINLAEPFPFFGKEPK